MSRKTNLEISSAFIITTTLKEFFDEYGQEFIEEIKKYDSEDLRLMVYAIPKKYEECYLLEFYYGILEWGQLELATGVLCLNEEKMLGEISERLPHILDEYDVYKLLGMIRKKYRKGLEKHFI